MKFVNREKELKYIRETIDLSKAKLFTLAIFGLRRVGKTRLTLEILREKDLYFFVNRESGSLLKEYEEILKKKGILGKLESLTNWDNFFEILIERYKGVAAFDEFQNFAFIEPSVFGILQKNIDLSENKKGVLFVFSGSTIGLLKKLFFDSAEPLYGRIKRKLKILPLSFKDIIKMCELIKIEKIEEIIKLYAIFDGYPRYYVSVEDEKLSGADFNEILEKFFFQDNAVLEEEISQILSLEFGKRRGIYYDILLAIAKGNTRISEISSFLRKKETALTRQLNELVNYFELVGVEKSVFGKKKLIYIKHPLINFWFRFFYGELSSYKRRENWHREKVLKEINSYIGRRFEEVCKEIIKSKKIIEFDLIGRQWGKFKGEKGKNTYEIDIIALNEKKKEILFGECKWEDRVNSLSILKDLERKSEFVNWYKKERKEYLVVFAKSFSKKTDEFGGKKVFCFDLNDISALIK